jgi:hypothetical protein
MACAALAAAGFMLAPAAHASSRPVQVNGNKLANALLPASQFGSDYQRTAWASSGKWLWHMPAKDHVASMSCGKFENSTGFGRFGETAAALSYIDNSNPWPDYPNTEFYYAQYVDQFASAKAATTFYNQARAKYAKCRDFTESVPADGVPGSGSMETTTQSVSNTSVGKYHAFTVGQSADLSDTPGITIMLNTLVTVEGTDVFTMVSVGGTDDEVPHALMLKLINRVKNLR